MLFGCGRARDVWKCLDLLDAVEAAWETDRAGEAILEELLCADNPGGRSLHQNLTIIVLNSSQNPFVK